jgi:ribosomal protein L7/L12
MDDDELGARLDRIEQKLDWIASRLTAPPVAMPAGSLSPDEVAAVSAGRTIQAISLYRERTGASLKEATDTVRAYRGRQG